MPLSIPEDADAIIARRDASNDPLRLQDVASELTALRAAMHARSSSSENDLGLWCEMMPLHLATSFRNEREDPWGSFFRPMSSMTFENGTAQYVPDVGSATPEMVGHWSERARTLKHPVLKARYADVVWDLTHFITKSGKRNVEMARIAVDAYIDAVVGRLDDTLHTAFRSAQRAIDLASQINDTSRVDVARAALLGLHAEVMASATQYMWSRAFDHLIDHRKARTTEAELEGLAADLEVVLARVSDTSKRETFDPHAADGAVTRLVRYYTANGRANESRRVYGVLARALEFHAGLGNATLAASFLQDSLEAYRQAGQPEEAERIRVAMQQKIRESRDEMAEHSIPLKITEEDVAAQVTRIVVENPVQTLVNIAYAFLPDPDRMERLVASIAKEAPLMAMLTQEIVAGDRVAARIGSVDEDPSGRIIVQTALTLRFELPMLHTAIHAAIERHGFSPDHLVGWANRKGLFDEAKLPLLFAGVQAWFNRDFFKTLHLIIPQIESALRKMVETIGRPTTKPAGTVPGVSVSINMGDIVFNPTTIAALGHLGPRLALYMKTVYADPRGMNLRNEFAHGLLDADELNEWTALWVIHSLLVVALWQKPDAPEAEA